MPQPTRIIILGSTGSIGRQTLEVLSHLESIAPGGRRFRVVGLAAGSDSSLLKAQVASLGVARVAIASTHQGEPEWIVGENSARDLINEVECDLVVSAIVGSAGLAATLAAVERGRCVALANKESLVAAGQLVVAAALKAGALILPVDSEHSGVWQCLAGALEHESGARVAPPFAQSPAGVARVVLTASGGPFRSWTSDQLSRATPAEALRHPTWTMGPKVTVDSASLMNKALELIEASWLFGLGGDKLDAVIHPQSIVHAMVERTDGSTIAQLGVPDMRTPIQVALTWPERSPGISGRQDLLAAGRLDFEPIDPARFGAIDLAKRVLALGGAAGAVMNAANEEAVRAFLEGRCGFLRIGEIVGRAVDEIAGPLQSLTDVRAAELEARRLAQSLIGEQPATPRQPVRSRGVSR